MKNELSFSGADASGISENADIQFLPHDFPTCRENENPDRYKIVWVDMESVKPSPENDEIYGEIDEDSDPAMQSLIDSIRTMGLEEPIILTLDGYILSGHRSLRFRHGVDVELIRIGVTKVQIDEHDVPSNFAKEGSSRLADYIERTGSNDTWECEALDPEYIQNAIEDALLEVLDIDQMNAVIRRENEEKMQISKIRQNLGKKLHAMLIEEAA